MTHVRRIPWLGIILLTAFVAASLYLRVALPYGRVFDGNWIKFTTNDAYYFMRQVDSLVANFPHLISVDPYLDYPAGASVPGPNLFVYILGGLSWLFGFGSPTQHTIDIVGVYFPAVACALTVIPVYFIGKTLFNRWVGFLSAAVIAILPGEFLGRTILGATDRDAIEVLFTALTLMFFVMAVKAAKDKQLTFRHLTLPNLPVFAKPLIYSVLTGISLGLFLLTWRGAFLVVLVILVYLVVQSAIDYLRRKSVDYLGIVCAVTFIVALLVFLPGSPARLYTAGLSMALLASLTMSILAWYLGHIKSRPVYYPLGIIAIAVLGTGTLFLVSPSSAQAILDQFRAFAPSATELTVAEIQPILFPSGRFTFSVVWANYTTAIFLSLGSLALLVYTAFKKRGTDSVFLVVWSLIIMTATLASRRMAVFFAINVALLTGYMGWQTLVLFGLKERTPAPPAPARQASKKRKAANRVSRRTPDFATNTAILAIIGLVFLTVALLPNIGRAVTVARNASFAPSNGWQDALTWLKDKTPEPLGHAGSYYDFYQTPFRYPETAYAVGAWWDFGYWILRIGHRVPSVHPGGGDRAAMARLLTAQDEATAAEASKSLGLKYMIVDDTTLGAKFDSIAIFAGTSGEQFFEIYYKPVSGGLAPSVYFYPEYYRTLAARLYYFDAEGATTDNSTGVISFVDRETRTGERYKELTSFQSFATVEEADAYISAQKSGNFRIASPDPKHSPVPLDGLAHYKLVYATAPEPVFTTGPKPTVRFTEPVKVFEFEATAPLSKAD